ncbi:carboxymuconolactone decarboxylase family protein [Ureibacillus sp. FSL K6-2830]|uniref:carboxymuconolactone decarboxylase family protein n=1 Tax=Ureibacillus sp. FSL K6-2830 TaxID=2954610 RepID=UPI0030F6E22E
MTSYYEKNKNHYMKKLKEFAPEQFKAFSRFDGTVFKPGALSKKEKEIIAVAIAHVTKCPYCIDVHTKKAKIAGACQEELIEAIFVVMAVEAETTLNQHEHALIDTTESFKAKLQPYFNFSQVVMGKGFLTDGFKELLAIAVAHAIHCTHSINSHTNNAMKLGVSEEQIAEAILVTAALKAGSAYAHLLHIYESYNDL